MQATQSHSMAFGDMPATRIAWPGHWKALADAAGPFIGTLFTAVVLGIVEEAVDTARRALQAKKADLRAYERVEWTRAEAESWLAVQAYEGMLRSVEGGPGALLSVLRGKMIVAELAVAGIAGGVLSPARGATPPRHPAVERDLAVVVAEDRPAAEVAAAIRRHGGPLLTAVDLFDVYRGRPLEATEKSLAWRLHFQAPDRTLTEDEIDDAIGEISARLATDVGGRIRS